MFRKLYSRSKPEEQRIIVVSGLPRSGTSMMMKMLAEGGLPIVADSIRQADEDNPNGYYEIEQSKALADGNFQWLYDTRGKVVKVISYLLEYLPDDLTYDVIFMERRITEILASQKKMLHNRNEQSTITDDEMAQQFREHIKIVKYWVARKPNMRINYVDYNKLMYSPELFCTSIAEFLGQSLNLHAMQAVPNKSLYRNRT